MPEVGEVAVNAREVGCAEAVLVMVVPRLAMMGRLLLAPDCISRVRPVGFVVLPVARALFWIILLFIWVRGSDCFLTPPMAAAVPVCDTLASLWDFSILLWVGSLEKINTPARHAVSPMVT